MSFDLDRPYFTQPRATRPPADAPTFVEAVRDYINAGVTSPYPEGKPSQAPNETRTQ